MWQFTLEKGAFCHCMHYCQRVYISVWVRNTVRHICRFRKTQARVFVNLTLGVVSTHLRGGAFLSYERAVPCGETHLEIRDQRIETGILLSRYTILSSEWCGDSGTLVRGKEWEMWWDLQSLEDSREEAFLHTAMSGERLLILVHSWSVGELSHTISWESDRHGEPFCHYGVILYDWEMWPWWDILDWWSMKPWVFLLVYTMSSEWKLWWLQILVHSGGRTFLSLYCYERLSERLVRLVQLDMFTDSGRLKPFCQEWEMCWLQIPYITLERGSLLCPWHIMRAIPVHVYCRSMVWHCHNRAWVKAVVITDSGTLERENFLSLYMSQYERVSERCGETLVKDV